MGLFDIFRRHKKKRASEESQSPASQASTTTESLSTASLSSTTESQSTSVTVSTSTSTSQSTSQLTSEVVNQPQSVATSVTASLTAVTSTSLAASVSTTTSVSTSLSTAPNQAATSVTTSTESTAAEMTGTEEEPSSTAGEATSAEKAAEETTAQEEPQSASDEARAEEEPSSTAEENPTAADSDQPAATETSAQTEEKYDRGLAKSRTGFGARLNRFLANFRHVDEDFFDDLEDMLIESDVGYDMAMKLSDSLREEVKLENAKSKQDVSNVIIEKMVDIYEAAGKDEHPDLQMAKEGPTVIMFVGVNGAGKTTTIGKMAARFKRQGKRVLLAAADTFRAGATDQLEVWAQRDGVDIVTGPENGDPAAVVFDAVQKAKKDDYDVLFVDTAGRLQNKVNLMNELAKMKRILTREIPDAPHEVLLVLDATTGQNALNQAKLFKQSTDVTGIVLTKLDGTARGGIVLAIRNELHLPVKYVGLGEKVDDLEKFNASDFVYGLFKGLVEVD
ncbi:signal recognition particle-docking protein FtsY [Limosilactobacillus panis]|uniref:Signal recognition particle receptor FtsY n=1 Tax=Limosilactobacillus panis TaxID=47493 RepID=A0ABT7VLX7_9LACO|nr:signal recognition particle-docking protein FtsY [Limosilactobacillus panis]MDM8333054.1 signal recognition particle-docking protein FtsY [Limosilactobacillus panis]HJA22237.1 signal recognition particle-docking protein FtsY [Candidatus Limosilactobacillus intestinipullorum]